MNASLWCLMTVGVLMALPSLASSENWQQLFNGRTLDGWVQRGGKAVYSVDDGCVVGTTVPSTPNSFLCTARDYTNFILEYEFKVDPALNSGVQIRSHSTNSYNKGQVHGCQVEIDMDPRRARWWSGGLYEEGRRGWLFPGTNGGNGPAFTAQGKELAVTGGWNKVRVEANGSRYQIWLSEKVRVDCTDTMDASGFIALQVHSVGKTREPLSVRWRNIRVSELAGTTAAEPADAKKDGAL